MTNYHPGTESTDLLWLTELNKNEVNAVPPLSFNNTTRVLNLDPASQHSSGYVSTSNQSFAGSKTFVKAPFSLEAPTLGNHLATKQYIDNIANRSQSWQDAINSFHDFADGDPGSPSEPLSIGDRFISLTNYGSFDKDSIYTCDGLNPNIYIESIPSEGWALYDKHTDLTYIYTIGGSPPNPKWSEMGISLDHTDLINRGTLTHAQIDDFLDQSVKTTGSPTFDALTITNDLTTKSLQASQYLRFKGMLNLTNQTGAHINQWIRIFKPYDPSEDCRGVLRLWTNRLSGNYSMEISIQIGSKDYALSVINMSNNASSTTFAVKFGAFYNNTDKQMHVYYSASDNASNYSYSHARGPIPEIDMAITLRGPSDQLPTELVGKDITYTYQNSNITVSNNFSPIGMSSTGELTVNTIGNVVNFHNTERVNILNPTDATAVGTGALVVTGGASVAKKLYVGDDINGSANATISGALSCGGSIQTAATLSCDEIACGISGSPKQLVTVVNEIGPPVTTKVNVFCDNLNIDNDTFAKKIIIYSYGKAKSVSMQCSSDLYGDFLFMTHNGGDYYFEREDNGDGGTVWIRNLLDSSITNKSALIVLGGAQFENIVRINSNLRIYEDEYPHQDYTKLSRHNGITFIESNASSQIIDISSDFNKIAINGTDDSSSLSTGCITIAGGVAISKNAHIGGTISIHDASEALDLSSGALSIAGGVAISKNAHIGGTISIHGISGNPITIESDSGDFRFGVLTSGSGYKFEPKSGTPITSGHVLINCEAPSISPSTGALIVAGGVGVSERLTASSMTCVTAPSSNTDVVRLIDLSTIIVTDSYTSSFWNDDDEDIIFSMQLTFKKIGNIVTVYCPGGLLAITVANQVIKNDSYELPSAWCPTIDAIVPVYIKEPLHDQINRHSFYFRNTGNVKLNFIETDVDQTTTFTDTGNYLIYPFSFTYSVAF